MGDFSRVGFIIGPFRVFETPCFCNFFFTTDRCVKVIGWQIGESSSFWACFK